MGLLMYFPYSEDLRKSCLHKGCFNYAVVVSKTEANFDALLSPTRWKRSWRRTRRASKMTSLCTHLTAAGNCKRHLSNIMDEHQFSSQLRNLEKKVSQAKSACLNLLQQHFIDRLSRGHFVPARTSFVS